jgi:superfamily II RNA helicase
LFINELKNERHSIWFEKNEFKPKNAKYLTNTRNLGYGRELSKILRHGVGIHHAGLLPKYRLLVENSPPATYFRSSKWYCCHSRGSGIF